MSGEDNKKTNQHYVPRTVLKHFTDNGDHVNAINKRTRKKFRPNIKGAATEGRFYDYLFNGEINKSLDNSLQNVENAAGPIVERLVQKKTLRCLSEEDRINLSAFYATLFLRTKATIKQVEDLNRQASEVTESAGLIGPDAQKKLDADELKLIHHHMLTFAYRKLSVKIYNMKWLLSDAGSSDYVLSDCPVVHESDIADKAWPLIGVDGSKIPQGPFMPYNRTFIPLCPKLGLSFYGLQTLDFARIILDGLKENGKNHTDQTILRHFFGAIKSGDRILANHLEVLRMNELQVYFAEEYVFQRSSDWGVVEGILNHDPLAAEPRRTDYYAVVDGVEHHPKPR